MSGSGRGDERRAFKRVDVVLKIEYQESREMLDDYITNLGEGGFFVHTTLPFSIGQRIAFSLSFPGLLEPIDLGGIVRWRQEADDGNSPGVGVEFVFEDQQAQHRLLTVLHQVQAEEEFQAHPTATNWPPAKDARMPHERPYAVLLVEDNEFVQEMFSYAVRSFDEQRQSSRALELHCAGSGEDAVEILKTTEVDIAIIDHYLPGMTGCQVVEHIRAEPKLAQMAVLVASVGGDDIKQQALALGADLFLHKPVMRKQLVDTIAALAARRSTR